MALFLVDEFSVMCLENDGTFMWRARRMHPRVVMALTDQKTENLLCKDLSIGPDGSLYIADYGNDQIQVLDRDGNYLRQFGEKVGETAAPRFESLRQLSIDRNGVVRLF